jgi:hypothetical protein
MRPRRSPGVAASSRPRKPFWGSSRLARDGASTAQARGGPSLPAYAAAAIADVIIAGPRLDPSRWAGRIAPRAFMMVSASDDERMPRAQVQELFRSAREPKQQIWMPGVHVHGDSATISRLVQIAMSHVREAAPPTASAHLSLSAKDQRRSEGSRPGRRT